MIQAIATTNLTTYLQTEDNRINQSVPVAQIRHLLKLVQGLVTKGKMYVAERPSLAQVQYVQREAPESTNTIYYGQ